MFVIDGVKTLKDNLWRQLSFYWGTYDRRIIEPCVENALIRLKDILINMKRSNKYIWGNTDEPQFTPYNSVQYSVFLYLLANEIYRKQGGIKEADIVYYLNKIMHSCD